MALPATTSRRRTPSALASLGASLPLLAAGLALAACGTGDDRGDAARGDPEGFCVAVGRDRSFFDRVQRALDVDMAESLPGSTIPPELLELGAEADDRLVAAAPAVDDPDTPVDDDIRSDVDVVLTARREAETTREVADPARVRAAAEHVDAFVAARCR